MSVREFFAIFLALIIPFQYFSASHQSTEAHYGLSGIITTPNYPAHYGNASHAWNISVPVDYKYIQLKFFDVYLEAQDCNHQYIKIRYNSKTYTHAIAKLCGRVGEHDFYSLNNRHIRLELISNVSSRKSRFLAYFKVYPSQTPACPTSLPNQYEGVCYGIQPLSNQILSPYDVCKAIQSDPASLTTKEENAVAVALLRRHKLDRAMIGLKYDPLSSNGSFVWVDGSPLIMTSWKDTPSTLFPTERCAVLNKDGKWEVADCNQALHVICEKKASPTSILSDTCSSALGLQDGTIPNNLIVGSSRVSQHSANKARLHLDSWWQPEDSDSTPWIQAKAKSGKFNITGIALQGAVGKDHFVKSFYIYYTGISDFTVYTKKNNREPQVLSGNSDSINVQYVPLNPPVIGRKIRIYPKTWTGAVAMRIELYGCLIKGNKTCETSIGMQNGAISDEQITASSTYHNFPTYNARLHLDLLSSPLYSGWRPKTGDKDQWLQILFNSTYRLTAVATQGLAHDSINQFVRTYLISYSQKDYLFFFYQEDDNVKIFEANRDKASVVKHDLKIDQAFVVRIHPQTWHSYISLRAEVYGCKVSGTKPVRHCDTAFGLESGAIPDAGISASTEYREYLATKARLNSPGGLCWLSLRLDRFQWIKVYLGKIAMVTGIATQGRSDERQWVKSYYLRYSNNGKLFIAYAENEEVKKFRGNFDQGTAIKHYLKTPIVTSYIRIDPYEWHAHIAIRLEIYGCNYTLSYHSESQLCSLPMGMETGYIPSNALRASSAKNALSSPNTARILMNQNETNPQSGWRPLYSSPYSSSYSHKWLQVDFGVRSKITGIAIQGIQDQYSWVTQFEVEYGTDGHTFVSYRNSISGSTPVVFEGNINGDIATKHILKTPIIARYVRIIPKRYYGEIALKLEFFGCGNSYAVDAVDVSCNASIGLEDGTFFKHAFSTSSTKPPRAHLPQYARLNNLSAWTAGVSNQDQWIQIHFFEPLIFTAIATQGRANKEEWVESYKVAFSESGQQDSYAMYGVSPANLNGKIFQGNTDNNMIVKNNFSQSFVAKFIKLLPLTWHQMISVRLELYGFKHTGVYTGESPSVALGMEKRMIPDFAITSSSHLHSYYYPWQGRLRWENASHSFWSPMNNDAYQWLQVDLGQITNLTGVATQGAGGEKYWVTSYILQFAAFDVTKFEYYIEHNKPRVFLGNTDENNITRHYFSRDVRARFARLIPLAWHQQIAVRMEFYGCKTSQIRILEPNAVQVRRVGCLKITNISNVVAVGTPGIHNETSCGPLALNRGFFAFVIDHHTCFTTRDLHLSYRNIPKSYQCIDYQGGADDIDFFLIDVNGGFTNWTEWTECDVLCGNGTQRRMRNCTNPIPRNAGKNCVGPSVDVKKCILHPCPQWSSWSECNTSCGPGFQNRTRECLRLNCSTRDIEYKPCMIKTCATFTFTAWGSWGRCYSEKPSPYRLRSINCTHIKTGVKCPHCLRHVIPCDERWSHWSPCSASCMGGNRTRQRNCYTCPDGVSSDGKEVTRNETLVQTGKCNTHPCPVDGNFTEWSNWTTCTLSCGNGTQQRMRNCTNLPPRFGGKCTGESVDTRRCNSFPCPVDGNFTEWSSWTTCSVTCGNGTQQRMRNCTNPPPAHGGRNCTGNTTDFKACEYSPCSIDGNFTEWSSWTTCSVTCGNGTQQRMRSCTNPPPAHGGRNCTGNTTDFKACEYSPCPDAPVNGNFSEWSPWTACTLTCGSGTQQRMRTCTNPPPANGGANCTGPYNQTQSCNTKPCPIHGNWTSWSEWSYCNRPCGIGYENSTRSCTNPTPMYGGKECEGPSNKSRICNNFTCPAAEILLLARFTKENWTSEYNDLNSSASLALREKIFSNVKSIYEGSSTVTGIVLHSLRNGSVVANFTVMYSTMNSLQLITLQEGMQNTGSLSTMPITVVYINITKVPSRSPTITEIKNISSTSVQIKWLPVPEDNLQGLNLSGYSIFYRQSADTFLPNQLKSVQAHYTAATIEGLDKYTDYALRILAFTANGNGVPSELLQFKTDEDVPGQSPRNVQVTGINSTALSVTWDAIDPSFHHGIFLGYNVSLTNQETGEKTYTIFDPQASSTVFSSLNEFTWYEINICGFTSKGCGPIEKHVIRTFEDKPNTPPSNMNLINLTSTSSLQVSWNPLSNDDVNGILKGYKLTYRQVSKSREPTPDSLLTQLNLSPSTTSVKLKNLESFSLYKIRVAAYTIKGDGPFFEVIGETCRCPKYMPTNFWVHNPYLNVSENDEIGGIFPQIVHDMTVWACGDCKNGHGKTIVDFKTGTGGQPALKKGMMEVVENLDSDTGLTFPVNGNKYMTKVYGVYPFLPLVMSPGVVYLTVTEAPGSSANSILSSVLSCGPLIGLSLMMAYLAGLVIWFLDSKAADSSFPRQFSHGAREGFWWAYITMTTVGYGDRSAVSFSARIFAILWTLYGIVLFAMVTSAVTSSLTTVIVKKDTQIYGAEIAAVENSSEHRLGILMCGRVNTANKYQNLKEIQRALSTREVQGALVDTYVAESEKSIFENEEIIIGKTLERSFGYGIAFSGIAANLVNECKDYVKMNEAEITKIVASSTSGKSLKAQSSSTEEQSTNIFSASSVLYKESVMVLGCMLCLGILCGLVWQVIWVKKNCSNKVDNQVSSASYRQDMAFIQDSQLFVEEFYTKMKFNLQEMKELQRKAIRSYLDFKKGKTKHPSLRKRILQFLLGFRPSKIIPRAKSS